MESIIRVSLGAAMCQPCQGAAQPKFGVWFGRPWIGQAWAKNETARGHMSQCKGNHDCYPNDALAHGHRPNFVRAAPGTHPNALLVTFFMFAIHGPFSILDSFSLFLMPSYSLQKHKTYMAKQAFLFSVCLVVIIVDTCCYSFSIHYFLWDRRTQAVINSSLSSPCHSDNCDPWLEIEPLLCWNSDWLNQSMEVYHDNNVVRLFIIE